MTATQSFLVVDVTLALPHAWVEATPSCVAAGRALRLAGVLPPDAEQVTWEACPHGGDRACRVRYTQRVLVPTPGEEEP